MEKFQVDDVIRFQNTGSAVLDGTYGTIIGHYADYPEVQFMIVGLPIPYGGNKAIVMITSCMELIHRPPKGKVG